MRYHIRNLHSKMRLILIFATLFATVLLATLPEEDQALIEEESECNDYISVNQEGKFKNIVSQLNFFWCGENIFYCGFLLLFSKRTPIYSEKILY